MAFGWNQANICDVASKERGAVFNGVDTMLEEIVRDFFTCSLRNNFDDFDFDGAFDAYLPYLHQNNVAHGLCDFEDYYEYAEGLYAGGLSEFTIVTGWIHFDENCVKEAIFRGQWEALRDAFSNGTHGDLRELQVRIESRGTDLSELIQLFDEAIHAEHCNGFIAEFDPDDIRSDVEEDEKKFPTNIRAFL